MKVLAATSLAESTRHAEAEVTRSIAERLDGARADLAFVFASPHHREELELVVSSVRSAIDPGTLLGCVGESIIGGAREYEGVPALSLWVASLPGVRVRGAHVQFRQTPDGHVFLGLPDAPEEGATLLCLADPFTFPADIWLRRLEEDHPALAVLGGMASGARAPGHSRLLLDDAVHADGAVVALLEGEPSVRPIVSQGCRPFGRPYVITKADGSVIQSLRGRPALQILKDEIGKLAPEERQLLAHGLHLGIAIDAAKERHERGDFLVRNVLGFDEERGAIIVTDLVRAGLTVQFHVRDAGTASEDLHVLLRQAREAGRTPAGALLFSCNGRGRRLFQADSHDAGAVTKELGDVPLAGFFAAGEIGPVGGSNFLHGFTASVALFER